MFLVQPILFKVLLRRTTLTQSRKDLWLAVARKNHSNGEKENAPKEKASSLRSFTFAIIILMKTDYDRSSSRNIKATCLLQLSPDMF